MSVTRFTSSILPPLLLMVAAVTLSSVNSQQFQQPPAQSLGDVLHQLLDKDKNQKVSLEEVNSQLDMLESIFNPAAEFGGQDSNNDDEVNEYKQLLSGFKSAAPTIFKVLDVNSDKSLSKSELAHVTKFEKALKKGGGMRELLRDLFSILDENADELLSVDELVNGCGNDQVITKISSRVHESFPLRSDADELKEFVMSSIESVIGGGAVVDKESVAKGMKWIDDDEDGHVSKKEVGKYYNLAGKKFMEISKTIKQLGPMLTMFGGMDMNGGGGDAFKMDL